MRRRLLIPLPLLLAGCAALPWREPPKVNLAGIEPLPAQGLEVRFGLKLRVQNPNDAAIDYDGIALEIELRGQPFASGVSDARGSIGRFSEALITVPVSVHTAAVLRQFLALGDGSRKLDFVVRGRLGGLFGGERFSARGELDWPTAGAK